MALGWICGPKESVQEGSGTQAVSAWLLAGIKQDRHIYLPYEIEEVRGLTWLHWGKLRVLAGRGCAGRVAGPGSLSRAFRGRKPLESCYQSPASLLVPLHSDDWRDVLVLILPICIRTARWCARCHTSHRKPIHGYIPAEARHVKPLNSCQVSDESLLADITQLSQHFKGL